MPKYKFRAFNENGTTLSDIVEADSVDMANSIITSRGFIPISVTETGGGAAGALWENIKDRLTPVKVPELILFTKQLKTMMRAGVSIVKILQVLENQTENPSLKGIISKRAPVFMTPSRNIRGPFRPCIAE